MAHAAVRDEAFQVGLAHDDERAVQDVHDREHRQQRRGCSEFVREHARVDAEEAVATHLQEHAREHHAHGRRRVRVRVRQPRVQRHDGQLHRERDQESAEHERRRHDEVRQVLVDERGHVERALARREREVEREDGREHERRTEEREQQELHRRVVLAPRPPDGDEEEHRHEFQLPEDEEQDQVQRREDAHDRALQQQQPHEVLADPRLHPPRHQHSRHAEDAVQQHQRRAQAVHTHQELDAERGDPRRALHELVCVPVRVEDDVHGDGQTELGQHRRQRDEPRRPCGAAHRHRQRGADHRYECDCGQHLLSVASGRR